MARISEKDIENLVALYPDEFFPGDGLKLQGQQVNLKNRFADLIFTDKHGRMIVVEVKKGTLERPAAGQVIEYYGLLKEQFPDKTLELILCANNIPFERRHFLERSGIECKEIAESFLESVAQKYNYSFLASTKRDDLHQPTSDNEIQISIESREKKRSQWAHYHSSEAFDKIISTGGSGKSRADRLYLPLMHFIEEIKRTKEEIVLTSRQLCGDEYFGTRTRPFIEYVCKKHGVESFDFHVCTSSNRKSIKFDSFKLRLSCF